MSYVKLFSEILDSTVWQLPGPTKLVWVTMLAMADKHGEVRASIPGLAGRAGVTISEAESALTSFMGPDAYSRTRDNDGRRAEEIDGGWLLLNHAKYRELQSLDDIRAKAADRQRRFRERRAAEAQGARRAGSSCESCGESFPSVDKQKFVVRDHNHATGQLRGFICKPCNKIVGDLENQRPSNATKTPACWTYLDRYAAIVTTPVTTPVKSDVSNDIRSDQIISISDQISDRIGVGAKRAEPVAPAVAPVMIFPASGKGGKLTWALTQTWLDNATEAFPDVDVLAEMRIALAKVNTGACRKPTVVGMSRFLMAWLGRTNDRGARKQNGSAPPARDVTRGWGAPAEHGKHPRGELKL